MAGSTERPVPVLNPTASPVKVDFGVAQSIGFIRYDKSPKGQFTTKKVVPDNYTGANS